MTTVTFAQAIPFTGMRPYADVVLNPGRPGVPTHKCLVDTGADYLVLPASAAALSGISLSTAVSTAVSSAAGRASMLLMRSVAVAIEGWALTVDVMFDPTNKCPLLAGRGLLLPAFTIGMEQTVWHRT